MHISSSLCRHESCQTTALDLLDFHRLFVSSMASSDSVKPPQNPFKRLLVDIGSGVCAGIAVTFVGHPFETLKVRLQTQPQGM